jgi:hypothetical protein
MAPEEVFDDPEAAEKWPRIACDAASCFGTRPVGADGATSLRASWGSLN